MSDKIFPKYNSQRRTGDRGVTFVKSIVEDQFEWIFRPTHLEEDFGLDGYFDIIAVDNSVTGKYLGVQIKTGDSYFKNETSFGWTYYGESRHLNYFLNMTFPILIIIVNLKNRTAFWVEFDVTKTSKTPTGWSIVVPKTQSLDKNAKSKFQEITGEAIDYMSQIEYQWELNEQIKQSPLTILYVSKDDIVSKNVTGFTDLLNRLTINDDMIQRARGKITFLVDDYNDDKREIYEIKEIREWVKLVIPAFKYWGYFLNMNINLSKLAGLAFLHFCSVDIQIRGRDIKNKFVDISADLFQTSELMLKLFEWLNEFTEKYSLSEDINKEQSESIIEILLGDRNFE